MNTSNLCLTFFEDFNIIYETPSFLSKGFSMTEVNLYPGEVILEDIGKVREPRLLSIWRGRLGVAATSLGDDESKAFTENCGRIIPYSS